MKTIILSVLSLAISLQCMAAETEDSKKKYIHAMNVIYKNCVGEWPENYVMQVNCKKVQENDFHAIRKMKKKNIEILNRIILICEKEWRYNYVMVSACSKTQYVAFREIQEGASQ